MSQDHPKLTFAYPTFVKVGMAAVGPFLPDIGWEVSNFPSKLKMYISVGLLLNSKRPYSYDISIFRPDLEEIKDEVTVLESRLLSTAVSSQDDFVSISTNLFEDISIDSPGLYRIHCRLYAGKAESDEKETIDQLDSYFAIAEDWRSNTMTKKE